MKALVIGGTGLVGKEVLDLLLADERFSRVVVFGRRNSGYSHPKLTEHIVDLSDPSAWRELARGDVLFSALGTTLEKAGGKMGQYMVDYTYQLNFAAAAAGNGVRKYALVSTAGADERSWFFYLRIKGELEEKVLRLPFEGISVLRPTQLYGHREEKRTGEERALAVMKFINGMGLFRGHRPVHARTVAAAMIQSALTTEGTAIMEIKDIRLRASEYNVDLLKKEKP